MLCETSLNAINNCRVCRVCPCNVVWASLFSIVYSFELAPATGMLPLKKMDCYVGRRLSCVNVCSARTVLLIVSRRKVYFSKISSIGLNAPFRYTLSAMPLHMLSCIDKHFVRHFVFVISKCIILRLVLLTTRYLLKINRTICLMSAWWTRDIDFISESVLYYSCYFISFIYFWTSLFSVYSCTSFIIKKINK